MKKMSMDVKSYLDSLPQNVKMSIIESNAEFDSVEDLRKVAEEYMGKEKNK